jgi:hypothetical protein
VPVQTELDLRLPNSPGALAQICELLAAERIGVRALALESNGQLRLVVDNTTRALRLLADHHHRVTERQVLVTQIRDSFLDMAAVLRLAAETGVNVEYAYSGVSSGAQLLVLVLGTVDAQRAATASGI